MTITRSFLCAVTQRVHRFDWFGTRANQLTPSDVTQRVRTIISVELELTSLPNERSLLSGVVCCCSATLSSQSIGMTSNEGKRNLCD
jgi:hypothetical protein